jgi:hypothetical protein
MPQRIVGFDVIGHLCTAMCAGRLFARTHIIPFISGELRVSFLGCAVLLSCFRLSACARPERDYARGRCRRLRFLCVGG